MRDRVLCRINSGAGISTGIISLDSDEDQPNNPLPPSIGRILRFRKVKDAFHQNLCLSVSWSSSAADAVHEPLHTTTVPDGSEHHRARISSYSATSHSGSSSRDRNILKRFQALEAIPGWDCVPQQARHKKPSPPTIPITHKGHHRKLKIGDHAPKRASSRAKTPSSAFETMARVVNKPIPLIFRIFFLYIEPVATALGAIYALDLFGLQNDYMFLTYPTSTGVLGVSTRESIVLNQLANMYFVFALNEALVLRATNDVRMWRVLLLGLLIADFGHLYSVHLIGVNIYYEFWNWSSMYWGNLGFVYVGAAMRTAFLLGAGFGPAGRKIKT
ncbi:hypothetical protein LTR29_011481 [Friedmanniomyces endolithicus]|nr:hypothetical protein LTR29_011481 [Friedmanniomyces endolithicus]